MQIFRWRHVLGGPIVRCRWRNSLGIPLEGARGLALPTGNRSGETQQAENRRLVWVHCSLLRACSFYEPSKIHAAVEPHKVARYVRAALNIFEGRGLWRGVELRITALLASAAFSLFLPLGSSEWWIGLWNFDKLSAPACGACLINATTVSLNFFIQAFLFRVKNAFTARPRGFFSACEHMRRQS